MRRSYVFLLIIIIFLFSGCKKVRNVLIGPEPKSERIRPIEDVDLAKAIIWPKPYQFVPTQDPFKPLLGNLSFISTENLQELAEKDIKILGILFNEKEPLVLLEKPDETEVFRKGDMLAQYKIIKIEPNKVILEKENKNYVLEIGEK